MGFSRDFMGVSMSADGTTLLVDGTSDPNDHVVEILVFVQFDGKLHQATAKNLPALEWRAEFPTDGLLFPQLQDLQVVGIATFDGKQGPDMPQHPEHWDRLFPK